METIEEKQQEFIELYNSLGDPLMQYEFLLQLAGETPVSGNREDRAKIKNCQTDSWFQMSIKNNCFYLDVDSDSLLIRGVLCVYVYLLNGRSLQEIIRTPLRFMEETEINQQLTRGRFSVLSNLSETIYQFCREAVSE